MTKFDPMAFLHKLEDAGMEHTQAVTVALIVEEVRATAKADGVYNAINAMRRLEASGFTRLQAETLADVLVAVFTDLRQVSSVS
jgi:hypothetical protein